MRFELVLYIIRVPSFHTFFTSSGAALLLATLLHRGLALARMLVHLLLGLHRRLLVVLHRDGHGLGQSADLLLGSANN
jgi:hypothetical protein